MRLKVRLFFRVLAGGVMTLGLMSLANMWVYQFEDMPQVVVVSTAVMTIACAYVALFSVSPAKGETRSDETEPNYNQDITPILKERSWLNAACYVGFILFCIAFLVFWDHLGYLYG